MSKGGGNTAGRTLYLHIGLPKTASTWLQREVFPALDHVRFIDTPRTHLFRAPQDAEAEFRTFACALRRSSTVWHDCGDAVFEEVLGSRDTWLAEDRNLLISDEAIGRAGSRQALLAAHLAGIAATAARWGLTRMRVLCLIRRQDQWLASHYAQVSDRAWRPGQRHFEALVARVVDTAQSRHEFGALLDFAALREAIISVAGADNLLILPQEALRETPRASLTRILEWLGTPADKASAAMAAVERTANVRSTSGSWRLRPGSLRVPGGARRIALPTWVGLWRGASISVTPEASAAIFGAYGDSNRRLAAAENLPLGRWGYFGRSDAAEASR